MSTPRPIDSAALRQAAAPVWKMVVFLWGFAGFGLLGVPAASATGNMAAAVLSGIFAVMYWWLGMRAIEKRRRLRARIAEGGYSHCPRCQGTGVEGRDAE